MENINMQEKGKRSKLIEKYGIGKDGWEQAEQELYRRMRAKNYRIIEIKRNVYNAFKSFIMKNAIEVFKNGSTVILLAPKALLHEKAVKYGKDRQNTSTHQAEAN